jgi:hypothetical protein
MIKTKQVMVEQEEYYCDICEKKANCQCHCCKKDLCYSCAVFDNNNGNDDYPDKYCKSCWEIGKPFREKIEESSEKSYKEEERLKAEWFKLAREKNGTAQTK